jgi:hypothetical protein
MAGSYTKTTKSDNEGIEITLNMIADGSGDCDVPSFTAWGYLYEIELKPGTASDAYNLILYDSDDLDILNGTGVDMSNALGMTLAEKYIPILSPNNHYFRFFGESLNLIGSNMGNGGTATVKVKFTRTVSGH